MRAEELLRRFDRLGGQVFHVRGLRACCFSTLPTGRERARLAPLLLPDVLAAASERLAARERSRADRLLLERARSLPPRLAVLDEYLRAVGLSTIANPDDGWAALQTWCRIVEACENSAALPPQQAAIRAVFEHAYGGTA